LSSAGPSHTREFRSSVDGDEVGGVEVVAGGEDLHGRRREAFLQEEVLVSDEERLQERLLLQVRDEVPRHGIVKLVVAVGAGLAVTGPLGREARAF